MRDTLSPWIVKELAEALGEDEVKLSDGLITLAGKTPSDLAETLCRNPGAVRLLSSVGDEVWSSVEWNRLMDARPSESRR